MGKYLLNLKGWQLFTLLSSYWVLALIIESDSLLLDVLFWLNQFFLFGWYYFLCSKLNSYLDLKLKYIFFFRLVLIYSLVFITTDLFFLDIGASFSMLLDYIYVVSYLFVIGYVTFCFCKAEQKTKLKPTGSIFAFILFFCYPVGVFYLSNRLRIIAKSIV